MVRRMVAGLALAALAVPALSACGTHDGSDALACHDMTARTTVREGFMSQGANESTLRIFDRAWAHRHCERDTLALP